MKTRLTFCILITTIPLFASLAACGNLPLAVPEQVKPASQSSPTPSPPKEPTGKIPPSQTTSTPVAKTTTTVYLESDMIPAPSTPVMILLPTPDPTPLPTATFEPLSDKPIGGYVFGQPELIPDTYGHSIQMLEYLPKEESLIVIRDTHLEILELDTGTTHRFWSNVPTNAIYGKPIWIPGEEALAIITDPENSGNYELWLTYANEQMPPKQLASDVISEITQIANEPNLLFLNRKQNLQETNVLTFQSREENLFQIENLTDNANFFQVATHPDTSWLAYYNPETFFLVNNDTKEIKSLDLGHDNDGQIWVMKAEWSPDGKKLALLTTTGSIPVSFSEIQIFNLETNTVEALQDSFQFVNDFAWASDSHQIVISAVIGKKEYYLSETESFVSNASALFLADIFSKDIFPIPLFPTDVASSGRGILWSTDDNFLIVWYREYKGSIGLYKVKILQS